MSGTPEGGGAGRWHCWWGGSLAALALALALACDASPPPSRPSVHRGEQPAGSPPRAPAPSRSAPDPDEPGISELARVARYVFREMQRDGGRCAAHNPFVTPVHFVLAVRVEDARMVEVDLADVAVERGGGRITLDRSQWPPEVLTYAECVRPLLLAAVMNTPVPDGRFSPSYGWSGNPSGRPAP